MSLHTIQRTTPSKIPIIPRLVAGGALLFMGAITKFSDLGAFESMLAASPIPAPGIGAPAAAIGEAIAGILLLSGFLTRFGGLMGVGIMIVAIFWHLTFDAAKLPEGMVPPPIALPVGVLAMCVWSTVQGGGGWSVDAKMGGVRAVTPTPTGD